MRFSCLALAALAAVCSLSSAQGEEPAPSLRVLTFNIRYANKIDGPDGWTYRRDAAAKVIEETADVAGLQEVLPAQRADLAERLPGFTFVGVARAVGDLGEGSPLFLRKERFTPLSSGTFWLSDTPDEPGSNTWGAAFPRVCTWAKVRDLKSGGTLWFYNTHFDHKAPAAREKSIPLLWQRIAGRGSDEPALLMGDFNMTAENTAFTALPMLSTYQALGMPIPGTFHAFKGEARPGAIDFIFLEKDRWKAESCAPLKTTYPGVDGKDRYVSDHFPVAAEVTPARNSAGSHEGQETRKPAE